ncbi:MAG: hypothetical protein WCJ56_07005 [bacterium]
MRNLIAVLFLFLLGISPAFAAITPAAHPFILWNKQDVAEMKKKAATEDWAKKQQADLLAGKYGDTTFTRLYRYQVLGDEEVGKAELDYLMHITAQSPQQVYGNIYQRMDSYLDALRYDVLYDIMTPEQRNSVEASFREYIKFVIDKPYVNDRLSILPNMQMPYILSSTTLAIALQDEKLINEMWAVPSGYQWFFNEYLSDGGLYNEEFNKMGSLVGEFLIIARGFDRIGLPELGYGYTGKGGASLRSYVESLMWMGYPRTDQPGGTPSYSRISMGDTRGAGPLQGVIVYGYDRSGNANNALWGGANMNGRDHKGNKVVKLNTPQWFEIMAAKYPEGNFSYFLAQLRPPKEGKYTPTPFWGLEPIDPAKVVAPAAPSRVYPERGFAMLRANETPKYWESPDPAVALQFATLYVHYTSDCFSLLGYYAYNRPIYVNRAIFNGYNAGPWDFSVQGHAGVVVDNLQAQPIGEVPTRQEFSPLVKFTSARGIMLHPEKPYTGKEVRSGGMYKGAATEVYPGVDLSRSLFLTKEYLFDVYQLSSEKPRTYDWLVHAPGVLIPTDLGNWHPAKELHTDRFAITDESKFDAGADPVAITIQQNCALPDVEKSNFGKEWYDRKIGVRVRLLGEPGTSAYTYTTPTCYMPGTEGAPPTPNPTPEYGGISVDIQRKTTSTAFIALHEPYEKGTPKIDDFQRIAQTADAVAVSVTGKANGVNDRLLLRWGNKAGEVITLAGNGESFTFADHGYLRISTDKVETTGDLRALTLKVVGTPKLFINGKEVTATVKDGVLTWVG